MDSVLTYQWIIVVASSIILFLISPWSKSENDFYKGSKNDKEANMLLLTASLVISWLFAKSITNAANLGLEFGIVGSIAYAVYYLSFIVCGWVIYSMRTQGGYLSIHHFISSKFGGTAVKIFSALILVRLINEVWSNTMVIGSYFGQEGTSDYYIAIVLFTILTLAYTLKGGLRSSILTDLIQMGLFAILLVAILGMILPSDNVSLERITSSGEWELDQGVNLLLVALIQIFSYPFHDPVMTDRAFLSSPKVTLKSFILAGIIGVVCILLFSIVGIYGKIVGVQGQAAVEVSKLLGIPMMLMINFIMITSAASTLDSTFNSFAKLSILDLEIIKPPSIKSGRIAIILVTIVGSIPIFLGAKILSATTVSGTMVLGLAPVFIFWKDGAKSTSFILATLTGLLVGILYTLEIELPSLSSGAYSQLLSYNLLGFVSCLLMYFIGKKI